MKNNMKNLAGFLLGEMLYLPAIVSISIDNEDEKPMVVAMAGGQQFVFTEENVDEWKDKYNYFETCVKEQETMSNRLREAAYMVLRSALETKAYTSMRFYPRQVEDDDCAFMHVYTSVGDDTASESFYEEKMFLEASTAKILTFHKFIRKEADNGNN